MKSYTELCQECVWLPYDCDTDSKKKAAFLEANKDKAVVSHLSTGYAHAKYRIHQNPNKLSSRELALFCDHGNLCFGYTGQEPIIKVYTD